MDLSWSYCLSSLSRFLISERVQDVLGDGGPDSESDSQQSDVPNDMGNRDAVPTLQYYGVFIMKNGDFSTRGFKGKENESQDGKPCYVRLLVVTFPGSAGNEKMDLCGYAWREDCSGRGFRRRFFDRDFRSRQPAGGFRQRLGWVEKDSR